MSAIDMKMQYFVWHSSYEHPQYSLNEYLSTYYVPDVAGCEEGCQPLHTFIHSFIQQLVDDHQLCNRHCAWCWGYSGEHKGLDSTFLKFKDCKREEQ